MEQQELPKISLAVVRGDASSLENDLMRLLKLGMRRRLRPEHGPGGDGLLMRVGARRRRPQQGTTQMSVCGRKGDRHSRDTKRH